MVTGSYGRKLTRKTRHYNKCGRRNDRLAATREDRYNAGPTHKRVLDKWFGTSNW